MGQPVYRVDTAFLALIISVISILSPVITAVMKNLQETKMKEIEFKEFQYKEIDLHKRDILEKALQDIGSITAKNYETISKFGTSCILASAYVDPVTAKTLEQIYLAYRKDRLSITDDQLSTAINGIKNELSKMNKS